MADGFIVRRGGKAADQTATPSILDFSTASATSIKFKLRNNDASTATLVYRFGTVTGEGDSISVAANTTTSEITLTVPTITAPTKLFVTANAVGKVKSEIAEQEFAEPIVYTAATGGTTNDYDSGGKRFRSHTFTSNGTFTVTTVGDNIDDRNKVDYLIIAGGAAGRNGLSGNYEGPGGGAGGYRTTLGTSGGNSSAESKVTVTATSYSVTIGAGGAADASGNNSSVAFPTTITSLLGGRGQRTSSAAETSVGSGGGSWTPDQQGLGTSGQGTDGGSGISGANAGGGGGGAGQAGGNSVISPQTGGKGGDGLANLLRTGSNETRAGGGGGSGGSGTPGAAGSGGAGAGATSNNAGGNATANTGSGGGGGSSFSSTSGGTGGSGIVVIRYEIAPSV
jgi:hypothetical protein